MVNKYIMKSNFKCFFFNVATETFIITHVTHICGSHYISSGQWWIICWGKSKKTHQKSENVFSIREFKCQEEEIDNTINKYDLSSLFVVLYLWIWLLAKMYLLPPPTPTHK